MPAPIDLGFFLSTPTSTTYRIKGLYGSRWGLLVEGDFGGGSISIGGGTDSTLAAIQISSLTSGSVHNPIAITVPGLYHFSAICDALQFFLAGGAAPSLGLILYAEARP